MRAKILAASVLCVVCASGTAAHAGKEKLLLVPRELAEWAGWIGRTSTAPEIKAMQTLRTLETLETSALVRQTGQYHSSYETIMKAPSQRLSDGLTSKFGTYKTDFGATFSDGEAAGTKDIVAPSQDATAAAPVDKTWKMNRLLNGTATVGATYCLVTDCLTSPKNKN